MPIFSRVQRGRVLYRLADLIEKNIDELAAIEALDNGKPFLVARNIDLALAVKVCLGGDFVLPMSVRGAQWSCGCS